MLRKTVLALVAFTFGFVLGSVFGFGNGVEYNQEKTPTIQDAHSPSDEPFQVDLEFNPENR